jgi:hypothetical protein
MWSGLGLCGLLVTSMCRALAFSCGWEVFTMAHGRLALQSLLESLLGTDKVYFQPPNNIEMAYPCIVYSRDAADTRFADNNPYHNTTRYQITVIDRDPDSEVVEKIAALPMASYQRFFVAENLNHDVYTVYF